MDPTSNTREHDGAAVVVGESAVHRGADDAPSDGSVAVVEDPPCGAAAVVPPSSAGGVALDELVCPTCGKVFRGSKRHGGLQSNYNRHLLTHSGDRPYPCTMCDVSFTTSTNLRRHEAKRHPPAPKEGDADITTPQLPLLLLPDDGDANDNPSRLMIPAPPAAAAPPAAVMYPCRNGCGREFSWRATRTIHERRCRELLNSNHHGDEDEGEGTRSTFPPVLPSFAVVPPSTTITINELDGNRRMSSTPMSSTVASSSSRQKQHKAAAVRGVETIECPDCGAAVVSRSKLTRHAMYHCPFRLDDGHGGCDDDDDDVAVADCDEGGSSRYDESVRDALLRSVAAQQAAATDSSENEEQGRCGVGCGADAPASFPHRRGRQHFPCPFCDGMFRNMRLLRHHIGRRHKEEKHDQGEGLQGNGLLAPPPLLFRPLQPLSFQRPSASSGAARRAGGLSLKRPRSPDASASGATTVPPPATSPQSTTDIGASVSAPAVAAPHIGAANRLVANTSLEREDLSEGSPSQWRLTTGHMTPSPLLPPLVTPPPSVKNPRVGGGYESEADGPSEFRL
jgi:uncharacterized C2H2 Zn-finger protein